MLSRLRNLVTPTGAACLAAMVLLMARVLPAQEGGAAAAKADLAAGQDAIALRYQRFEKTLLALAESMRKTDPDRAELLRRAVQKSKDERISLQMEKLVELLREEQLGDAAERQGDLQVSLQRLLELLMSEDLDRKRAEEERRIKGYIREINDIIARQKDARAANERGDPTDKLVPQQDAVTRRTEKLRNQIDKDDQARNASEGEGKPGEGKPGEGKPGEGKPGEGKPGEGKPGEGQPGEGKPGEGQPGEGKPGEGKPGEGKPGEGKPGEGMPGEGMPGEGMPGEGKPGEGKPGSGQPGSGKPGSGKPGSGQPGESTPGRDQIEEARQQMEQAAKKLREKQNKQASVNQDEAIKKLEEAKEKFEEILRQLREEERKRFLAMLEARFQKMLEMQKRVNAETVQIDRVPVAQRESRHTNKSLQLSRTEAEIALEATKALTLLREEGSAVAFPEAVEQMRDDMQAVVVRLSRTDVGEITQAIEADIVEALEEMIQALQKEMEKMEDEKKPPPDDQPQQPQDPALVEVLAELKLLRSLQKRINSRTQRLGRLSDGEQASDPQVVDELKNLSERQARVQKATYDLATGRNK